MNSCLCGCGKKAKADFLSGHDQKLRSSLENKVGGLLPLKDFVNTAEAYAMGKTTEQDFLKQVRAIFTRA